MAHILAKLKGVKVEEIGKILRRDAPQHAAQGMFLVHLWQNADAADEALFLFRTDDLDGSRQFIEKVHSDALRQNPDANLPRMIFLEEC